MFFSKKAISTLFFMLVIFLFSNLSTIAQDTFEGKVKFKVSGGDDEQSATATQIAIF